MFAALAVLRLVLLANAVGLNLWRRGNYVHPELGAALVAVMVVWTLVALVLYRERRFRGPVLLVADLAVAVGVLAATPFVKGAGFNASVPGFWVAGALLAWAVAWRVRGGLVAALVLAAVDLLQRQSIDQTNYANVFLLVVGGAVVGYLARSLQTMALSRAEAERRAAVAAERARLARAVHDGVLQVLALVQRRGSEAGGEFAELGRLAGEQEEALRTLIRQQDATASPATDEVDLAAALTALASTRVHVVTTGGAVLRPAAQTAELLAAVGECLANVTEHVGADAPAWVLLDVTADEVVVSVRDEGPGIAPQRLAAAEAEGRLGVSSSVRGRLADLGGRADLDTGAWGTEWELAVPR